MGFGYQDLFSLTCNYMSLCPDQVFPLIRKILSQKLQGRFPGREGNIFSFFLHQSPLSHSCFHGAKGPFHWQKKNKAFVLHVCVICACSWYWIFFFAIMTGQLIIVEGRIMHIYWRKSDISSLERLISKLINVIGLCMHCQISFLF